MKPNFALSLSFEGIGLLKRVAEGWHLLGEVTLDSADLAAELSALRAEGEAHAEGAFTTAVVLPNDQIKYLDLETGRAREAKRKELAIEALEQSTPYRRDQLIFVTLSKGRATQVAAVARETLDEAEAFATEHAFNPICFTAMPPDGAFDAAPDFGLTQIAPKLINGAKVTLETDPICIVARGPLPRPEPGPEPSPEPRPQAKSEIEAPEEDAAKPGPAQTTESAASETAPPPETPAPEPEPAPEPQTAQDAPGPVSFSSIRARRDAPATDVKPELAGATRGNVGSKVGASVGANAPSIPADHSPTAERNLRFDPAKVAAGLKADAHPRHEPEETTDSPDTAEAPTSSFLSRRNKRPSPAPAPKPAVPPKEGKGKQRKQQRAKSNAEQQRLTVFGARAEQEVGGKPRYLGLVMTVVLLLFLAAVAVWATVFLEDGVAGLFKRDDDPAIVMLDPEAAVVPDPSPVPVPTEVPQQAMVPLDAEETAPEQTAALATDVLEPAGTDSLTDSAKIEAMTDEIHPTVLNETEAAARYAVTGIWERAPEQPQTPSSGGTEDLYAASIDRVLTTEDAVALPDVTAFLNDRQLAVQLNPLDPATEFELDERGLVVATAGGSINPQGILVYAGRPPVLPASLPDRSAAEGRSISREEEARLALLRPRVRPDDLSETNERATLGGLSRSELASIRPKLRPTTEKEAAEADNTPTQLAIASSLRPRQRPSNIAQLAQRSKPTEPVVAVPAAATLTPKIPTTASVARQATIQNAINLNKINLIGVYGTSSNRRALVRLANGRYKKVQVGDRIDGGKVATIDDKELRYIKSGKNIVLKMPKG